MDVYWRNTFRKKTIENKIKNNVQNVNWTMKSPRKRKLAYRTVCGVELAAPLTKTCRVIMKDFKVPKNNTVFPFSAKHVSSFARLHYQTQYLHQPTSSNKCRWSMWRLNIFVYFNMVKFHLLTLLRTWIAYHANPEAWNDCHIQTQMLKTEVQRQASLFLIF